MTENDIDNDSRIGVAGPVCSKDLKRYFYVIGVVAAIVLFGAFMYRGASGNGLRLGQLWAQLGHPATAVNAPTPVQRATPVAVPAFGGGIIAAPPYGAGGMATLPPLVEAGPASAARDNFSNVVSVLRNSVVSVTASSGAAVANDPVAAAGFPPDGQARFANPTSRSVENIGSGVVVRNDGYVLTNYHVVRGANTIFVTVQDDMGSTRNAADVVKMDEALDLALVKIVPKVPLSPAVLGDSGAIRVADEVIAIGTPFGLDMTVSRGIISAKRKSMVIEGVTHTNLLQTDAAINQGNSGGPLVDRSGTVIGINTAIYTPNGAFAGIGFAVPSNQARLFILEEIGWLPTATAEGPQFGLVALQQQGAVGAAGPAIAAGVPAPHTDGRQNMECTTCHDVIRGGAGSVAAPRAQMGGAPMMPIAAPGVPPPAIAMGTPSPHTDGRQTMDCAMCHKMLPSAGMPAAYQFAQPPGSLAMNVMGAPAPAAGRSLTVQGATLRGMPQGQGPGLGRFGQHGVTVATVAANSAAAAGGLRAGDVLLKVDGRPVRTPQDVAAIFAGMSAGRSVRLGVLRDGEVRGMEMPIGPTTSPIGIPAAAVGGMVAPVAPHPVPMGPPTASMIGPRGGAVAMQPVVPTEFNWRGLEIEVFQSVAPAPGTPAGIVVRGAAIGEVLPGSRAALVGLKVNDVILEVNNQKVPTAADFDAAIKRIPPTGQSSVLIKASRNGQEFLIVM
jgi:S1-C subfamily serine protease